MPASSSSDKAHCVTGAFGFSGRYIARRLLNQGHRVVTLTGSPNRPNSFGGRVEARPLNFNDAAALAESLKDVSVLYNTYWVRFNHNSFSHTEAVRNSLALFEAAKKAGVERIVHVSIANADPASPLGYFSAKGHLEGALKASGLSHAIVRPAVLFGREDILINNIAWTLRRFPVFALFGDGGYHIQPIYVDDLASLMVEQGKKRENTVINALGPEDFIYRDLVAMIAESIGKKRRMISLPPRAAYMASKAIGFLVGDEFITREEIKGLMGDLLHVPGAEPAGTTRLSAWVLEHRHSIGTRYHSEMDRRLHRDKAY